MFRNILQSLSLLLAAVMLGACQQTPFATDAPRTQYQRHDEMRGEYVPSHEVDPATGVRRPNLRERLSPERRY